MNVCPLAGRIVVSLCFDPLNTQYLCPAWRKGFYGGFFFVDYRKVCVLLSVRLLNFSLLIVEKFVGSVRWL
jgi:hypothetical protein